jgi:hypothetical protein
VATEDPRLLVPLVSVAYAIALGAALFAIDQLSKDVLAEYLLGPWFEVLSAAVLVASGMTIIVLLRAGLRRRRDGLPRRAWLWAAGAVVPAGLAALALFSLVESAQNASLLSGADVHLTRPVIESLPRPPSTKLIDERPGLADTETIYQDFTARDVNSVIPFYEAQLPKAGWVEDNASASSGILRFTKGTFVVSLELNPRSGGYTLTVDHVSSNLLPSPPPSPS